MATGHPVLYGVWRITSLLRNETKEKENLMGILLNIITIITMGIYAPIDGPNVFEDSSIYDPAFSICYSIGTCGD